MRPDSARDLDRGESPVDNGRKETLAMTEPPKTPPQPLEYSRADSILFQAWLVLFLVVICFALVNYLLSYI
jgi:hypothetical protein